MLQPLLESQGGQQQNLPAAGIPVLLPLGDEGHGGDVAGQLCHALCQDKALEIPGFVPRALRQGLGPAALAGKTLHVDFRNQQPPLKAALRQHRAVFRDELVGSEHQIRSGLPRPGAGIDIAAEELGALHGHQLAAVGVLAHHIVAGGEVANDGGSRLGHPCRGGVRGPEVLADFKSQGQAGDVFTLKNLPGLENQGILSAEIHHHRLRRSGGKPALFVKLAVIGQVGLGDQTQDLPFLYNCGRIIQFVFNPQRQTQRRHHLQVACGRQHGFQALLRLPQEGLLIEKIAAAVARQAQLRQNQDFDSRLLGGAHHLKGLLGVVGAVRQPQLRRAAGYGDKSMLHKFEPPVWNF